MSLNALSASNFHFIRLPKENETKEKALFLEVFLVFFFRAF